MSNSSVSTHTSKLIAAVLRGFRTPYASSVLGTLKVGGKSSMPDPEAYSTAVDFAKDYLAWNLLRKCEDPVFTEPPSEEVLIKEAVSGFLEVERRLSSINVKGYSHQPWYIHGDEIPGVSSISLAPQSIIEIARRKIHSVLGAFDPDEMVRRAGFSNGASTRLPRKKASVPMKFTGRPHVTRNCALLAVCALWHSPVWRRYCQTKFGRESDPMTWVRVVPGSEYFTVPKTFDTRRGAAKEPELNMLLQKGIGAMIRSRLRKVGIDLNDQSRNQQLARIGSLLGSLVTIDLAAASDSVSLRIVEDLLPHDWVRFLMLTRSERIKLPDGSWHTLEKISSMGNGFTFELESLIFWALASASVTATKVEDRRVGVYGDDLIVHHVAAPVLIRALKYCGFETNADKTWVTGPFRESCGKHYWYGVDVSPFNVKRDLSVETEQYHFVNRLRLWIARVGVSDLDDQVRYILRSCWPKADWTYSPPDLGTKAGLLVPNVEEAHGVPLCRRRQGWVTTLWMPTRMRTRRVPGATGYMTWFQSHGEVRTPLWPDDPNDAQSEMDEENVLYIKKKYRTSRWPDCKIGSVKTFAPHFERAG